MDLKSRIENHIVLIVISACVTTGGGVFAVSHYFYGQSLARSEELAQLETEKLESRLASIERGLSKDSYLDIRQLLRPATDDSILSKEQSYFPIDRFYANREINRWQYENISEAQYSLSLQGKKSKTTFVSTELDVLKSNMLHLWRGTDSFLVQTKNIAMRWYPHILVQRVSLDDFNAMTKQSVRETATQMKAELNIDLDDKTVNQQLDQLSEMVHDDIVGMVFHLQLDSTFKESIENPDIRSRLVKNQKLGNVLYAQFLTEYQHPKVNKTEVQRFYLRHELILISTQNDIYLVKIVVPSYEPAPRRKMTSDINNWLASLKVAID